MLAATRVGGVMAVAAVVVITACSSVDGGAEPFDPNAGKPGFNVDAGGTGSGLDGATVGDGANGVGDSGNRCGKTLTGTLRDFKEDHPDFEFKIGDDPGIVQTTLGADGKPVYAGSADNPTTTSKENFDQWFRDVAGVNQAVSFPITLSKVGSVYTYENGAFFPLDGKAFGNETRDHNFHFTYELKTTFQYNGGETFKFVGDDDLFVFINKKLAIDLGGVHGAQTAEVNLDAEATKLGIEKGKVYPLDFFFAERHTSESNFRIDTTLDFVSCGDEIK